jgi:hypothetical protein
VPNLDEHQPLSELSAEAEAVSEILYHRHSCLCSTGVAFVSSKKHGNEPQCYSGLRFRLPADFSTAPPNLYMSKQNVIRRNSRPNRPHLGRLLDWRHLQPARSHRADHLPPLPRRLDEFHTLEELKATRLKKPIERRILPEGKDSKRLPYDQLRWSRFKNQEPRKMFEVVSEHVFPCRTLGGDNSTYAHHLKDARFTIPTPALLAKVVDLLDRVPIEDRDTKGDLYEYMLSKIATAGQNGQFRTPRHIIRLMVELTAPKPTDVI